MEWFDTFFTGLWTGLGRVSLDTIVQGVLTGGLYALYAAGLSLIFGVMGLVNLAHGDLIVLAAYAIVAMVTAWGLPVWVALLIAMPFLFAFGFGLQRVVLNRTLRSGLLVPLLVTFGIAIIIQNGLLEVFSADSQRLRFGAIETQSIDLGIATVGVFRLLTLGVAVAVILALSFLFYGTRQGRMLRATSDSAEYVQLMGVNPRIVFAIAMGISFLVIGIAAMFMGVTNFFPTSGPANLLTAFEAVVIGGLGSLWGTLVGGIIIGIAQNIGAAIDPGWQQLGGHIVFLVIVLLRPRGLFSK